MTDKRFKRLVAAFIITLTCTLAGSLTAAHAATDYTVPAGTAYIQVDTPASHGKLTFFAQDYTDNYIHEDPIPASSGVTEIDNFTGQAPDVQGWDGCTNSKIAHSHQPDQLSATDNDSAGLGGGTTPQTKLHAGVTVKITPVGSGQYFLVCHYEHGPETWVKLTFADGTVDQIYWASPTYYSEIFITYGGTSTSVTATGPDE